MLASDCQAATHKLNSHDDAAAGGGGGNDHHHQHQHHRRWLLAGKLVSWHLTAKTLRVYFSSRLKIPSLSRMFLLPAFLILVSAVGGSYGVHLLLVRL